MNSIKIKILNFFSQFVPMSVVAYREGYTKEIIFDDIKAGITVGLIALPLSIAFAIGSGVAPQHGLYTAIIAGFLISLLGGSRVQIGGPTGAFVIIIFDIVQRHGFEGLALATFLGGAMMMIMGFARFGIFLKFIPYPVTVGFTTGIAAVIFTSQMNDFLGLCQETMPKEFLDKWVLIFKSLFTCNLSASFISFSTLGLIFLLKKLYPRLPFVIISISLATVAAIIFGLPIDTIHSKFGTISNELPKFHLPTFSFDKIQEIFPDAIAIALLGSIESLLSAVVADGMTGHRHRSNCELVAQGFANMASASFGGIAATGAIARTSANINMGGKTPLAGMTHAITLLLIMLFLSPFIAMVPLAALSAVLVFVAWNMSDLPHFFSILKGEKSDALILVVTFLITIFIDLIAAVEIGFLLAAVLFVKRMSDKTTVNICKTLLDENAHEHPSAQDSDLIMRKDVPKDTSLFEINGPFFFAVSDLLNEQWNLLITIPKVFILRMRKVTDIDSSGIKALKDFAKQCHLKEVKLLLSGVNHDLEELLDSSGIKDAVGKDNIFNNLEAALIAANKIIIDTK